MIRFKEARRAAFQSTLPAGGATCRRNPPQQPRPISIHAPRGGSDMIVGVIISMFKRFQSTLPAGGATTCPCPCPICVSDFNPRSPRGERHLKPRYRRKSRIFQSTLPAGGATSFQWSQTSRFGTFQSTLPAGGATFPSGTRCLPFVCISIHAPRGGSDTKMDLQYSNPRRYFNPRSPRGERLRLVLLVNRQLDISIHAPRGGSDGTVLPSPSYHRYFNPRSPRGERPNCVWHSSYSDCNFNPRSPRGERLQSAVNTS